VANQSASIVDTPHAFGQIGPPTAQPKPDWNALTNFTTLPLHHMYEGQVSFLGSTIDEAILFDHNAWLLTEILPLTQVSGIEFSWTTDSTPIIHADQIPDGGMGGLIETNSVNHKVKLNRYGLSFHTSNDELNVTQGRSAFTTKLASLILRFADTLSNMGLVALRDAPDHRTAEVRAIYGLNGSLEAALTWERFFWDISRKYKHGMDLATTKVSGDVMNPYKPNHLIVPQGMRTIISIDDAKRDFYLNGPGNQDYIKMGRDAPMIDELSIHEVREYTATNRDGLVAPLARRRTIGDHFRMWDHLKNIPDSEYRSDMRTVHVFDMSTGDGKFTPVTLKDALRFTHRFATDDEDGALSSVHDKLAKNMKQILFRLGLSDRVEDNFVDPLLYTDDGVKYKKASIIGQLDERGMPDEAVRATAGTVRARILETLTPEDREALRKGLMLINRLYNKPLKTEDRVFMNGVVNAAGVEQGVVNGAPSGASPLPDDVAQLVVDDDSYYPAGYGSIPGLLEIADLDNRPNVGLRKKVSSAVIETAVKFARAIDSLYDAASSLFVKNHPAFDPKQVPVYFAASNDNERQNAINNFACNLLDRSKQPIYLNLDGNGGADLFEGVEDEDLKAALDGAFNGMRVTPEVRRAFGDAEAFNEFSEKFAESLFANLYRSETGIEDTSFKTFVNTLDGVLKNGARIPANEQNAIYTAVVSYVAKDASPPEPSC
jgi:hypothetical protein